MLHEESSTRGEIVLSKLRNKPVDHPEVVRERNEILEAIRLEVAEESGWADRIKKEHDLVTYQEVLAFWNGEPVDRDTERGRRERLIPRWMKVVRIVGWALFGMAVGFFIGYGIAWLTEALLG